MIYSLRNVRDSDSHSFARLSGVRGSIKKMRPIANLIRGKSVDKAFVLLKFNRTIVAEKFLTCLNSAIANALSMGLPLSDLYISEVYLGKDKSLKRFMPRGRGKSSKIYKIYSNLLIVVGKSL